MQKDNFKNLLEDLYNIYNPANLEHIEQLVERYSGGMEFDAVKNIFIKYNHKNVTHYDPELGTDEYILNTIKEYGTGSRFFQSVDIKASAIQKKKAKENSKTSNKENEVKELKQISKTIKEEFDKSIQKIESLFSKKEKEFNELIAQKLNNIKDNSPEPIIRIISTYTNSELNLPNKKYLANLGIGARIITADENNKVIGLVIADITIDYFTNLDGVPIIEITVNKA